MSTHPSTELLGPQTPIADIVLALNQLEQGPALLAAVATLPRVETFPPRRCSDAPDQRAAGIAGAAQCSVMRLAPAEKIDPSSA